MGTLNIYSRLKVFQMEYPKFKQKDYIGLNGTSKGQLIHPHFEKWQEWFINSYKPPKNTIALFIPCAAIKPYFNSPIHKIINKNLVNYENKIHKIVISNAGVIPYEFSDKYPFDSYDWNPLAESEFIKKEYYEFTKKRLFEYLKKHKYNEYISYLRQDSLSFKSLIDACNDLDLKVHYKPLKEEIESDKDSDLVLIYSDNLKTLKQTIEETL